jgi:hypothetical protein
MLWFGLECGPDSNGPQDLILFSVHGTEAGVGSIVEPAQVQHPMNRVQQ